MKQYETSQSGQEEEGEPEAGEDQVGQKQEPVIELLDSSLENLGNFSPENRQENFFKEAVADGLQDVKGTLAEGDDPFNLLVAYRGVEEMQKNYSAEGRDFGLDKIKRNLAGRILDESGFEMEDVEDLDLALEENRGDLEESAKQMLGSEKTSLEQLRIYQEQLSNYLTLKKQVAAEQKKILGESKKFYRQMSQETFGKLIEMLTAQGKKIDQKAVNAENILLKKFGEYGISSKLMRAAAMSLVAVGSMAFVMSPETGEAAGIDDVEMENLKDLEEEIQEAKKSQIESLDEKVSAPPSSMENAAEGNGLDDGEMEKDAENVEEDVALKEKIAEEMKEIKDNVLSYIKDLGFFSKLGLIDNIKKNAEGIEKFIYEDDEKVLDSANEDLKKIMSMYTDALKDVKEKHPDIYDSEAGELMSMVEEIKTSSLLELKSKFG